MDKLISVVVPVKNSYRYLLAIIETISGMDSDEIEMVISDNTDDNDEICQVMKNLDQEKIRYFHHSKRLSMTENFEFGIGEAKGKYICILGADDNISPRIIDAVDYLNSQNIESAIFNKASYRWPGMKFRVHEKMPSLTIYRSSGRIESIDVDGEYRTVMRKGCVSLGLLPEPYHGVVSKECLEKVKGISGRYVPGACPDMAMAISLSRVVNRHVFIDAPFTVSGQSYDSAGGKGARGEHKGSLKNKSFLPENIEDTWPDFLPKIWTDATIYADSMYSTLKFMGLEDDLRLFDRFENYAYLISFYPEYFGQVEPFLRGGGKEKLLLLRYFVNILLRRSYRFAANWMASNLHVSLNRIHFNVESSFDAVGIVDEYLETRIKGAPYLR